MQDYYTKVQNYFLHALCRVFVKTGVMQTVLAIFRLTIGFHLTQRALTYEQMTRFTGYSRGYQGKLTREAIRLNMLECYVLDPKTRKYLYCVNLDPLTWKAPIRFPARHFAPGRKRKVSPTVDTGCVLRRTQEVSPTVDTPLLQEVLKEPWRYGK